MRLPLLVALLAFAAAAAEPAAKAAPPASAAPKAAAADPLLCPLQEAEALSADYHAKAIAMCRRWLESADLKDLPMPQLAADPRASEQQAVDTIRAINGKLQQWRDLLGLISKPIPAHLVRDRALDCLAEMTNAESQHVWAQYCVELAKRPRQ